MNRGSHMKNRKKLLMCLIILLNVFHVGCVKDYSKEDVANYVKKKYSIKSLKIVSEGIPQEGEDGYTDTLWTIYEEENDVTFHVLDNVTWGMETVTNYLLDDYEDQIFLKYAEENALLEYQVSQENGLSYASISASFKNRQECKDLVDALKEVYEDLKGKGFEDLNIRYRLKYENTLRYVISRYEVDDGDATGSLNHLDKKEYEEFEKNYLLCALDYRFEDALKEFSEEEIKDFIAREEDVYHICNGDVYYEDLVASRYAYGISFGTLYVILKKEGFDVSGDVNHYQFIGEDGSTYEIGYDFVEEEWYYYKKDGEIIKMDADFYNHFSCKKINEMTGLHLETKKGVLEGTKYSV